ncbi:MAG: spermine synthase [Phototrophicales bacterium]|nr:MAG: spermine synthase [Phototrophicales bacterium]
MARPILQAVALTLSDFDTLTNSEVGLALGSFVSVLLLFSAPITLLGMVSPFAIRLAIQQTHNAGQISGNVYAISTAGSILGTFLPVLVITPTIGTIRTFLFFASILLTLGFLGLFLSEGRSAWRMLWMPTVLLILSMIVLSGPLRPAPRGMRILYERDSAYNLIQIVEDQDGMRYLLLNEGQGYHSQWHPEQLYYRRTWSYFLVGPYFNTPPYTPNNLKRVAIIGLAGGTIARQYTAVYGDIAIDGIEIDGAIVDAARQYLGMNFPNLNVIVQDGRYAFNQLEHQYDVVGIDAYRVPYVPWHLTTVEFFEEIHAKLTTNGVVIINVGRTPTDRSLVEAMTATMQVVFPSVHTMDVPNSLNTILVATRQPTSSEALAQNLALLSRDMHPMLFLALETALETIVPTVASDTIFTDDHAPVEQIVDRMVIEYLLGEQ